MSEAQPKLYKVEPGLGVKEQIHAITATCQQTGKLDPFIDVLEKAAQRLQMDPHGFGDPQYRAKFVDGVACHALIRPVAFRFVIYEQVRTVVLTEVRLYANFD